MFTEAKLVFKHYVPDDWKKGMLFAQKRTDSLMGKQFTSIQVYALDRVPNDIDAYIQEHGYPVQPFIVQEHLNPDDGHEMLVNYPQIGWFDKGDSSDELEDITIMQMNIIMDDYDGECIIEVDNEGVPILYDGKITIRFADNFPQGEDDDMDWEDVYEDCDETFDDEEEPDVDSAGFTENDRLSEHDKNDLYERDN